MVVRAPGEVDNHKSTLSQQRNVSAQQAPAHRMPYLASMAAVAVAAPPVESQGSEANRAGLRQVDWDMHFRPLF